MKSLRTKGKSTIVWLLMGLLILGLGGFGVTNFSGGSSTIGSVGDTKVTAEQYARALQSQINAFSQQSGTQITMAQAQSIGLTQSIQAQLFTAAALEEQTKQTGISVGDAQVAKVISNAAGFKGPNGKFDRTTYKDILAREGLSEAEFEEQIRVGEAQQILERAVTKGIVAPKSVVDQTAKWRLEQRDFSYHEVTEDQLADAVSEPDDEALQAWHKANADRFTAPEKRKLTYLWLTPEMLAKDVELNEEALRASYEQRIDEYQQPERRLVERLVFPSKEDAEAAKKKLDAGELTFEKLVTERGLTLDDVDLGEIAKTDLGEAGEAVFGIEQPGVVGPVQSNLGPALFSMNAILEPIDISFEEAQEELRAEAAIDRAARIIEDRTGEFEDMLVGGATLEDVAKETEMESGEIEWTADMEAPAGSIAGHPTFRKLAAEVTSDDFPTLERLDDGGIFAVRLDDTVPPTLTPFDEIRDEVVKDWRMAEVNRLLLALADELKVTAASENVDVNEVTANTPAQAPAESEETEAAEETTTPAQATPSLNWIEEKGLGRDGWIDGLPQQLITGAFGIKENGDIEVIDTGTRVFLVRLDAVAAPDLSGEDALRVMDATNQRMKQSLQADVFDYYSRAIQGRAGVKLNQSSIDAINTRLP